VDLCPRDLSLNYQAGARRQLEDEAMQLIAFLLLPVATAAGFLLAAALASGAREDAFRAGFRAGLQAASLALTKIAGGLSVTEDGQQEDRVS